MILSDEVIKDGLNYHNHWISLSREILAKSHLEANARIKKLETKLLEIGTALGMADNLGTIIEYGAIHAKDLSDDLSRVNQRKMELWVKLQGLREIIERNSKDLPSEFSQLLDDHFWEIA